ncbi:hypothetical protein T492DRAFT_837174 [Pavlovales sp. CCMP2436]|nr:hypothetical protein T492DRAFT_837174 [Pavlovales sp. CCMP2436]
MIVSTDSSVVRLSRSRIDRQVAFTTSTSTCSLAGGLGPSSSLAFLAFLAPAFFLAGMPSARPCTDCARVSSLRKKCLEPTSAIFSLALSDPLSDAGGTRRARGPAMSASGRGTQLVSTNLPDSKLSLDAVVTDDRSVLTRFTLQSHVDTPLRVKLHSTMGEQLGFQLSNENLDDGDGEQVEDDDFNALFNYVNLIDELELDPRGTQTVVVSFRPRSLQHAYGFQRGDPFDDAARPLNGSLSGGPLKRHQEIILDECAPGRTSVKDFTIWNRSEVPLQYALHAKDAPAGILGFSHYDTGEEIEGPESSREIPGYAHERIRLTYAPPEQACGELQYLVEVENLLNLQNTEVIVVHATVNAVAVEDALSVTVAGAPVSTLDFGDCYALVLASRLVTLRNMTGDALEVRLLSDAPAEVAFDLRADRFLGGTGCSGSCTLDSADSFDDADDVEPEALVARELAAMSAGGAQRTAAVSAASAAAESEASARRRGGALAHCAGEEGAGGEGGRRR